MHLQKAICNIPSNIQTRRCIELEEDTDFDSMETCSIKSLWGWCGSGRVSNHRNEGSYQLESFGGSRSLAETLLSLCAYGSSIRNCLTDLNTVK